MVFRLPRSRGYSNRVGSPNSRLAAVSNEGAVALLMEYGADANPLVGGPRGILARVERPKTEPRRVIGDVAWADWSPKAGQWLVVRR